MSWNESKPNVAFKDLDKYIEKQEAYVTALNKVPDLCNIILAVCGPIHKVQVKTTKSPKLTFFAHENEETRHCIVFLRLCKTGEISFQALTSYCGQDPRYTTFRMHRWNELAKSKPTKSLAAFLPILEAQLAELRAHVS